MMRAGYLTDLSDAEWQFILLRVGGRPLPCDIAPILHDGVSGLPSYVAGEFLCGMRGRGFPYTLLILCKALLPIKPVYNFLKSIYKITKPPFLDILSLFCDIDDFCHLFEPAWRRRLLASGKCCRHNPGALSLSEVMTILVLFHASGYRDFNSFYTRHVTRQLGGAFPRLVSYNRFVEL